LFFVFVVVLVLVLVIEKRCFKHEKKRIEDEDENDYEDDIAGCVLIFAKES
jgi:hypothetical protein